MNNLKAYKMDGLGNDFIIFDKREKSISLNKEQIIKISDRKNIGCDQVIFIDKEKSGEGSLKFYNSDGGETSACGNGSRCVAYLLMKENNNNEISMKTKSGILQAKLNDKNCDWIIANDVSKKDRGFNSDFNEVTIYYKNSQDKKEKLFLKRKSEISEEIVDRIVSKTN